MRRNYLSISVRQGAQGQQGFSLIEIMVVVAIMGIMAALIVPNVISRPDQARTIAARQDISTLMQALKLYKLDNGKYPDARQGLGVLVTSEETADSKTQRYLDALPNDPWGNPYHYLNPGVHGEIDVFSLGADGKAGGKANEADIGSWTQ